ncbi:hypothetical protein COLU111180_20815 [Cohnella lubricantis]|uniref:Nucleotidyltransferase family protein n=1 Tax=Cohnella lubricantis TaxID=2163172 RepID=A0A841TCV0_9BACL|nr:hypothetical protein [Cohnella lubricantis]MBB6677829.1 hypothetical protein [Cohnella lubricantis]MBP2120496.1 hypothetical protein [Cohnella lubricantis]
MNHLDLLPIVKRLEAYHIPYALGGSGMLRYLNLIHEVNDWDLMVECPKSTLIEAIQDLDWAELPTGGHPFASPYRISIESLQIDFIGHFALHTESDIFHLPIASFAIWDGIRLSSPEVWYIAYSLMGRTAKANLLQDYLKSNRTRVNTALIEHMLQTQGFTDELRATLSSFI